MESSMERFIHKAKRLGLWAEYSAKVDKAASKKQFMDIALDGNGLSYVSEAIAKWHLLAPEYIASEFEPFNNGRYVRNADGFSSAMYCLPDKDVKIEYTASLIIGYNGIIEINRPICALYIVNSDVIIDGNAKCMVYLYNSKISGGSANICGKEDNRYE